MSLDLSPEIFIDAPVPPEVTEAALTDLLAFGLGAEEATGEWAVELVLGTDALLRQLHRDFMGLDSPTDIMTFPEESEGHDPAPAQGGQIYISVDRALEQAAEFGLTPADEIRFLVLHGVLHLCGWDDDTDAKRAAMLDRQAEILRQFDQSAA